MQRRMLATSIGASAALLLGLLAQNAASLTPGVGISTTTFVSPSPGAVVDLGREVPFRIHTPSGACKPTHAVARISDDTYVRGPAVRGCTGVASIPSAAQLRAAGWSEGEPVQLGLVTETATVLLFYKHLDPSFATVLAGGPAVVPALGDPQGDGNSLAMQAGDAVELGRVDLAGIYATFIRAAGYLTFELRAESATGPVLSTGTAGHARSDWTGKPRGLGEVYLSATAPLKVPTSLHGPTRLVLVVTDGAGLINYLDLTGSGAMAPHRFSSPLPKSVRIFNGRDVKGWKQIGPGKFAVEKDGSLRASGPSAEWGWLYNPQHSFTNFVLRLEVKEQSFGANGGILIRHGSNTNNYLTSFTADEIQVTDNNTEYSGGIDHVATALRQPQSSPGEWSTFEIIANGPRLLVRVNGVVTADHDQTTGCNLPSVPCSGGALGGYLTGGSGFIGLEAELQNVWYRNVDVHDCGATLVTPGKPLQSSSDPLCQI